MDFVRSPRTSRALHKQTMQSVCAESARDSLRCVETTVFGRKSPERVAALGGRERVRGQSGQGKNLLAGAHTAQRMMPQRSCVLWHRACENL